MQIISLKHGTREWVRISGEAKECKDLFIKKKMLEECPILMRHFSSYDAPHYIVFKLRIEDADLY